MEGLAAGAIMDLMAAGGAGSGDKIIRGSRANGGKEDELADLHGDLIVLLFIAERSGHTAAAAGNHLNGIVPRKAEGAHGGFLTGESFLKTMTVEMDGAGFIRE